jgi:hypothetical protein
VSLPHSEWFYGWAGQHSGARNAFSRTRVDSRSCLRNEKDSPFRRQLASAFGWIVSNAPSAHFLSTVLRQVLCRILRARRRSSTSFSLEPPYVTLVPKLFSNPFKQRTIRLVVHAAWRTLNRIVEDESGERVCKQTPDPSTPARTARPAAHGESPQRAGASCRRRRPVPPREAVRLLDEKTNHVEIRIVPRHGPVQGKVAALVSVVHGLGAAADKKMNDSERPRASGGHVQREGPTVVPAGDGCRQLLHEECQDLHRLVVRR